MKRKEINNLAKKIAQREKLLQASTNPKEKKKLEDEIIELMSHVSSIEDMLALDEATQDLLMRNS